MAERSRRKTRDCTRRFLTRKLELDCPVPFGHPNSHAPHFKLSPRLAAKNKWARIEALRRNRAFLDKYRDAIKRHLEGLANVLFPFGTYWMKRFGNVACEAAEGGTPPPGGACTLPAPA